MRKSKQNRSTNMIKDLSFPKLRKVSGGHTPVPACPFTELRKCYEPDMVCVHEE